MDELHESTHLKSSPIQRSTLPRALLQGARLAHQLTRLHVSTGAVRDILDTWSGKIVSETPCIGAVLEILPLAASLRCLEMKCSFGAALELVKGMASRPGW